jgi:hypothetical protein
VLSSYSALAWDAGETKATLSVAPSASPAGRRTSTSTGGLRPALLAPTSLERALHPLRLLLGPLAACHLGLQTAMDRQGQRSGTWT